MKNNVTVIRYNDRLKATDDKLCELIDRSKKIGIEDNAPWTNQIVPYTRHLWNMLQLSRVITLGALLATKAGAPTTSPSIRSEMMRTG